MGWGSGKGFDLELYFQIILSMLRVESGSGKGFDLELNFFKYDCLS